MTLNQGGCDMFTRALAGAGVLLAAVSFLIPAPEFGGSFLHQAVGVSYGLDLKYNF